VKLSSKLHKKILMVQGKHGTHRQTYYVADAAPKTGYRVPTNAQTAKVETVSPKSRINVSYGLIFAKRANADVNHAIGEISKVHNVPITTPHTEVNVTGVSGAKGANGYYDLGSRNIAVMKYGNHVAATVAHEYGHFLDHNVFGTGKYSFESMGTVAWMNGRPPETAREMNGLMTALYRSKAGRNLIRIHQTGGGMYSGATDYLLMPTEMMARAYAQWIGTKTKSPTLRAQIQSAKDEWDRLGYPAQWEDHDFHAISREFDRLFARRGYTHRSG